MDYLHSSQPTSIHALPAYPQYNSGARGKAFSVLSYPAGHSISPNNNTSTLHFGSIPISSGLTTNQDFKNSHARQVDSIFANRNPYVRRRLYSGSCRSTKQFWSEKKSAEPPTGFASVSVSPREQYSISPGTRFDEVEPDDEWICISPQYKQQPCLDVASDIWHRRTSTSTCGTLPLLGPSPVTTEESDCSVETHLKNNTFESVKYRDDKTKLELNGEYEVVQQDANARILEEWEVVSPLSAQTSYCGSDDDFWWEEKSREVFYH